MSQSDGASPPRLGRPRRFDTGTERAMVMDAATRLMIRKGYADLSVVEILAETGLSTRSFYRHFESKEALVVALLQREGEAMGRSLGQAVALAHGPVAAVDAWLECFLDVHYEPKRCRAHRSVRIPFRPSGVVHTCRCAR